MGNSYSSPHHPDHSAGATTFVIVPSNLAKHDRKVCQSAQTHAAPLGLDRVEHQRSSQPHLSPASSCKSRQFSSRSCLAYSSVFDGRPSLSKCFTNRPSLRAKSMNVTSCFVLGSTNQSSFTFGLPCNDSRFLTVSPCRGS